MQRSSLKETWLDLPDESIDGDWPEGWTKKIFERQSRLAPKFYVCTLRYVDTVQEVCYKSHFYAFIIFL